MRTVRTAHPLINPDTSGGVSGPGGPGDHAASGESGGLAVRSGCWGCDHDLLVAERGQKTTSISTSTMATSWSRSREPRGGSGVGGGGDRGSWGNLGGLGTILAPGRGHFGQCDRNGSGQGAAGLDIDNSRGILDPWENSPKGARQLRFGQHAHGTGDHHGGGDDADLGLNPTRILLANGSESSEISDLSRPLPTQKCGLCEFANSITESLTRSRNYPETVE
jgi:hypothetical protein